MSDFTIPLKMLRPYTPSLIGTIRTGFMNTVEFIMLASLCWALLAVVFYLTNAIYAYWLQGQPVVFGDVSRRALGHGLRMWRSLANMCFVTLLYLQYRLKLHANSAKSPIVSNKLRLYPIDYAVLRAILIGVFASTFALLLIWFGALTLLVLIHRPLRYV